VKVLPGGSICATPAGAVCYHSHCLPLRDWLPLMLQLGMVRRWQHVFKLVVANSESVQQYLAAEGIGPVEVIRYGIPAQPPAPPPAEPPTAVFAGRLVHDKGCDILLHAFANVVARVPRARLLIAGDGAQRPALEQLVDSLDLRGAVQMLGLLDWAQVQARLAGAWVQVAPSRMIEAFGLAAAEAMMRGTAVVASDRGGLCEVVRHGETGLLVPGGDVAALADAIVRLLTDRALAERMGAAGRAVALREYAADTFVDRMLDAYTRVAHAPRTGD
jgi:glycosyltransferase involved in cell wall biosynthesis